LLDELHAREKLFKSTSLDRKTLIRIINDLENAKKVSAFTITEAVDPATGESNVPALLGEARKRLVCRPGVVESDPAVAEFIMNLTSRTKSTSKAPVVKASWKKRKLLKGRAGVDSEDSFSDEEAVNAEYTPKPKRLSRSMRTFSHLLDEDDEADELENYVRATKPHASRQNGPPSAKSLKPEK
jgi:hypothetical protein